MSELICPIMSCRTTSIDNAKDPKSITPTVVKCQKETCAWWDNGNACCAVLGVVMEIIKTGEQL
jgi:hypothetical protein